MEQNTESFSTFNNSIDIKNITVVNTVEQFKTTDITQVLTSFNTILSECEKDGDKIIVDNETERKLMQLYIKLPWDEQLKLRMSKKFLYIYNLNLENIDLRFLRWPGLQEEGYKLTYKNHNINEKGTKIIYFYCPLHPKKSGNCQGKIQICIIDDKIEVFISTFFF